MRTCLSTPLPTLLSSVLSANLNSDIYFISCTSFIVSGTRYLLMFTNLFICFSLCLNSLTPIQELFMYFKKKKRGVFFSVVCVGKISPPSQSMACHLICFLVFWITQKFCSRVLSVPVTNKISFNFLYVNFLSREVKSDSKINNQSPKILPPNLWELGRTKSCEPSHCQHPMM